MKGLEVSIQEILNSMQVRKIKSTNDINCLRCSYNSFLPILNHLSLLAKFHLSSQKLFTRYYIRFEPNHKQPAWECVPPLTFCILHKSCICVCGFLFFFYMSSIFRKKKKKCTVYMYVHLRRWLGCTNKKTWHAVYIDQYRFLPLTIWNLIIPKSCVRADLQRELINKSLIRVW